MQGSCTSRTERELSSTRPENAFIQLVHLQASYKMYDKNDCFKTTINYFWDSRKGCVVSISWPTPVTLCFCCFHTSSTSSVLFIHLVTFHPFWCFESGLVQPWKCTSNIKAFSGLVWSQVSFSPKSARALHKTPNCWIWLSQSLYWIHVQKALVC